METYAKLEKRVQELETELLTQKQAENALKHEFTVRRALFAQSPDSVLIIDPDTGRFMDFNDAAHQKLGYSREEFALLSISDVEAQETAQETKQRIAKVLRNGRDDFETLQQTKQGEIRHIYVTAQSLTVGGQQVYQCIWRDITERKRTEEKLLHMHKLMHYVISHANAAIAIHDREMNYIYVSDNYLKQYKIEEMDVIGKNHYDIFPDLPQKWRDVHQRVLAGAVERSDEDPYVREDGSVEWTRWNCRPWYERDGSIGGLIVYTEVITKRKQKEAALQESEERYRKIFEEAGDYVLMLELKEDGIPVIVDANARALLAHGVSREDLIGKPITMIDPEMSPEQIQARRNSVQPGRTAIFEVKHQRNDGKAFDAEARVSVIRIGGKDFIVSIERDITERKRLEEEHKKLEERLRRSEKMEALGQLAGGVAHDLNNVLGVLSGYSELLMEKIPADNPLRKYAENIFKSTEKGAAIIQDLLTLARRGVVVSQVIDINSIVSNLLASVEFGRLNDYHPGVTFRAELEKGLLNIKGSSVHLEKTVMNLVSNAAEAMVGDGEVTIRTENRYLDKAVRRYDQVNEGDYVLLSVSDTGKGIPDTDLHRIFEPFYTKKKMGRSGTGLGLSIVWGTVKDHDGYIDVQSVEGKGTTFTLYFPVTREEMAEEGKKIPVDAYKGHGESVLVVDDVEGQRMVATALLTELAYQVHAVCSGEEAVEYLKTNQADILVLDMIMEPGIDGLETYKRILQINPRQKAVIVSGYSETEHVKEAQKLGAGAYVKKPYVIEKIGMAIRNELDKK